MSYLRGKKLNNNQDRQTDPHAVWSHSPARVNTMKCVASGSLRFKW